MRCSSSLVLDGTMVMDQLTKHPSLQHCFENCVDRCRVEIAPLSFSSALVIMNLVMFPPRFTMSGGTINTTKNNVCP